MLIYILGMGHCGSTLLARCLGRHSQITNAGEVTALGRYLLNNEQCTCGVPIDACKFWHRVGDRVPHVWRDPSLIDTRKPRGVFGQLLWRLASLEHYKQPMQEVFAAIRRATDKPFVVDSSKTLKQLSIVGDCKVVMMARHPGHWVTHQPDTACESAMTFEQKAQHWAESHCKMLDAMNRRALIVRYEDFASDPELWLKNVCHFAGVEFEPDMLGLDPRPDHQIRGNQLRFGPLKPIQLIETWREKLTEEQLATVRGIAACAMKRLGYE